MKSTIFALFAATIAAVSAAPTSSSGLVPDASQPFAVQPNISIPPSCVVCDGIGLGCIAACIAGGPLDPACDACAGGSLGIIEQCITVRYTSPESLTGKLTVEKIVHQQQVNTGVVYYDGVTFLRRQYGVRFGEGARGGAAEGGQALKR